MVFAAPPQPAPPARVAYATASELRSVYPIQQIAVDGQRVVARICDTGHALWRAGRSSAAVPTGTLECVSPVLHHLDGELALGGARVAWRRSIGNNGLEWSLETTEGRLLSGTASCCAGDPLRPGVGRVLAQDGDLVYSTWSVCYPSRDTGCSGDQPPGAGSYERLVSQVVVRVDGVKSVPILSDMGEHAPLALDHHRLVLRTHGTSLELIDLEGHMQRTIDVGQPIDGAALSGDDLVAIAADNLRVYSAATGALLHVWPLPAGADLAGAALGRAAYLWSGTVWIVRLRNGSTTSLGGATHARLDVAGLFYSYDAPPPWRGRVRFVAARRLP
jgi:hypothetical protein